MYTGLVQNWFCALKAFRMNVLLPDITWQNGSVTVKDGSNGIQANTTFCVNHFLFFFFVNIYLFNILVRLVFQRSERKRMRAAALKLKRKENRAQEKMENKIRKRENQESQGISNTVTVFCFTDYWQWSDLLLYLNKFIQHFCFFSLNPIKLYFPVHFGLIIELSSKCIVPKLHWFLSYCPDKCILMQDKWKFWIL